MRAAVVASTSPAASQAFSLRSDISPPASMLKQCGAAFLLA
jgi:hypothetical protein